MGVGYDLRADNVGVPEESAARIVECEDECQRHCVEASSVAVRHVCFLVLRGAKIVKGRHMGKNCVSRRAAGAMEQWVK